MLINGEETDGIKFENKILTVPYSAGTEKIEVYGSYVVPEFGTIAGSHTCSISSFYHNTVQKTHYASFFEQTSEFLTLITRSDQTRHHGVYPFCQSVC